MILIKKLKKSYANRTVIDDLNLELPSNKLVFVVGKSGIGKSTFLKLISGYEKQDSGTIEFVGYKNFDFKDIDFVFQDFNLIKGLSVLENMQVGVNVLGVKFDKQKALEILKKIDISFELSKQKIENLSGGEQQRVAIARSILRNSKILLTDEPTGNLDYQNSEIIFKFLKEISKTKTVIVVTHDIKNAQKFGDYIVEIKKDGVTQYEINQSNSVAEISNTSVLDPEYKTKNKAKLIPKFLKNDIKRKVIQMFLVVLAFVATVITFGSLMQLQNGININNSVLATSYLETDKVTVKNKNQSAFFSNSDIDSLKQLPNLKNLSKSYSHSDLAFTLKNQNDFSTGNVKFIDFNQFYEQRNENNISEGKFPINDNEIIISRELARRLKLDNPIGETVVLRGNGPNSNSDLKVVAVNDNYDITQRNNSFISNNLIKQRTENILLNFNLISLWKNSTRNPNEMLFSDRYEVFENIPNDQIIQSDTIIDNSLPMIWISNNIVTKDMLNLNDKIYANFKGRNIEFNLAGVINNENSVVAVSQKTIDQYNVVEPNEITLYFNENVETPKYIEQLAKDQKFQNFNFSTNFNSFTQQFISSVNGIVLTFQIVVGLLILISILFTLGFTKILNDSKKEEIGLLKSLGSSLKQTLTYHVSYFIFLNFIVLVFSLILFVPFQIAFRNSIESSGAFISDYTIGFQYLILMWAINLIITTSIYSLFSYIKFRKRINNLVN